jgi:PAS domain S-box-containing protein
MRAFLDTSLDGIITMDFEGRILQFNPTAERLFGFRSQEVVGKRVVDLLVPPSLRADHVKGLSRYLRTGEGPILDRRIEMPALRSDGTEFPVELSITRIMTPGMPVFMGHVRDISERVEAERRQLAAAAELREANRKKTEFLATLSHELRNPLAPIRNALELLRRDRSAEGQGHALPIMERQLNLLVRLVDDLLDVSRITRSTPELRRSRIALAAAVRNAIETSRPLIEERSHHLTVSLPGESIWIDADLTRMAQVFSNLLNNAARYTEPRGRISLVAERQAGHVLVKVRDTGMGISPEHLPGIFDMFSQVDQSLHRAGGLGIGLTLVKRLVELHGGTVEAHSGGLGKGSEFTVRLPLAKGPPEARSLARTERQTGPRRRILVVDDNRDATETLSLLLERMGHETYIALDGVAGVEAASTFLPDVVLLDIGLPKLSGYDVCERIRSQPWGKDMVVIALTGWGQEADKARAMQSGFSMHLVKPVDIPELERLLGSLAGSPS